MIGPMGKLSFFVLALSFALVATATALAQNSVPAGPRPAAYGPSYDVSFGYSYLTSTIPTSGRANLNGFDAAGRVDFSQHWGGTVDAGYVRTSNVLSTGNGGYDLTFLVGPVFYPVERGKLRVFLHGLVGAGVVDAAVPVNGTKYLHGWVVRPAYALGGGVERSIVGPFGLRLSGDYLRTSFVNSAAVVQPQNNLRFTLSIVFRLNNRQP